ncbi:MAG: DUF3775 domain-containing protein [Planctomycetes bacterium]|nr:DUF3775 domain-containing protein [Planctomycetota bacterium]
MKLSEVVGEIIRLGEASRAYWESELPKRHPHYPIIHAGEDSVSLPPEETKIQELLKSLPENQLYALMVLAYVGRGDYSADNLLTAYQNMKETFPTRDVAIAQLTGKETLAEYLTDAMDEVRKRRIDLDSLTFESTLQTS